jgi:hypothetical protein
MKLTLSASVLVLGSVFHSFSMAADISLRCNGEGSYYEQEVSVSNNKNKDGRNDSTSTRKLRTFQGIVRFNLSNYTAKVKIPKPMVPLFPNEDSAGWMKVDKLDVNDREIRGVIDMGTFTSGELVIDRRSGDIEIDGNRKFSGACTKDSSPDEGNKF